MKKQLYSFLAIILICSFIPNLSFAQTNYTGLLHNGSATIPIRGVFQSMGAKVNWEQSEKRITLQKDEQNIVLQVGNSQAIVNNKKQQLQSAPIIQNGVTYLPLRFIAESFGAQVIWDQIHKEATINTDGKTIQVKFIQQVQTTDQKITKFQKSINGISVTGVKIPANAGYRPKMVLAHGQLGKTQSLAGMAQSNKAAAAINGTFFEAYGGHPDPWNQIIKDGEVVHIGNTGSSFGFTKDGRVKLEKLKINIKGATNESYKYPNNWYAFGMNHLPTKGGNLSYIFTPKWGKTLGFNYGKNIVVDNGVVTKISSGDVSIPLSGFVISLHGSEKYLESRFTIGSKVEYQVSFTNHKGNEVDWSDVETAVGAGPSLVKDGKIIVDAASEGFTEAKILNQSLSRSAIGVTAQGDILLIHTKATIQKLAEVMKSLGAVQAMNLDGGASSGLYLNGSYLVSPGRNLSNALVFVKQ